MFTTIFVISAIYLFNVNPALTVLNAFSFYRDARARWEEERLAKAPPEEQLEVMRKRTQRKIEELQRKAREGTTDTVPGLQSTYEAPDKPDLIVGGRETPAAAARRVIETLAEKGYA